MTKDIDASKHFRRLGDGRYLFRAGRWSRTVILDADTAQRVHEGRERYARKFVMRNSAVGGLGAALGVGLHRSGEPAALVPIIVGIVLLITVLEYCLRERAYHKWVRRAPTSGLSFPVRYSVKENLEQATAVQPLSYLITGTVLCALLTLLFLVGSVFLLIADPLQGVTLMCLAFAVFMATGTALLAYQWRLKLRMSRDTSDK